jgi:hypothetical protein
MTLPMQALRRYLDTHSRACDRARVLSTLDVFASELSHYAELIVGPGRSVVGFMTRGEGESFTDRLAMTMRNLAFPESAVAHHFALAQWFEHTRGFAKLEWHVDAAGELSPMMAVYYRRRPAVETALARLHSFGVAVAVQDELRRLAYVLEKSSIHFVAAAFHREQPIQHKLYFSQLVIEERKPAIEDRLGGVFDRIGRSADRSTWLPLHRRALASPIDTTLFVSFNFTDAQLLPMFKIDYPDQLPDQVAMWAPVDLQADVEREASEVARAMSCDRLAYLGVRFGASLAAPRLKYYADLHGNSHEPESSISSPHP